MEKQRLRRALLAAAFIFLAMPWAARADIDPATVSTLLTHDGAAGDYFGRALAVDGNTAVIGASGLLNATSTTPGAVYVFTRSCSGCDWTLQQQLTATDGDNADAFGATVAISGDTIAVGAPLDADIDTYAGSAYVFTRSGSVWTQQQKLTVTPRRSVFGIAVAIEGDTLVVGAKHDSTHGLYAGAAYVYTRTNGVWGTPEKLYADDADPVTLKFPLDGREACFGSHVAISGNTIVVGAPLYGSDTTVKDYGAAYVFTRPNSSSRMWTRQQLTIDDGPHANDLFGRPVAIDGDTILVGSIGENGSTGAVYVFTRSDDVWTTQKKNMLAASDGKAADMFAYSIAVDGDTALVGAYAYKDTGAVYIFTRSGNDWTQKNNLLTVSDGREKDYFGSVAIDGDTVLVGASSVAANPARPGSAYAFNLNNHAPVAEAGPDQAIVTLGTSVQLDGSQSWDADGDALAYSWSFVSTPEGSSAVLSDPAAVKPTFQVDKHGDYTIQLTVSDGKASSTDQVLVSFANIAPVASAGQNQSAVQGETVCFDGIASADANGDPLTYTWTLTVPAGSSAVLNDPSAEKPCVTTDLPGTYAVSLIVNDGAVDSTASTANVVAISYLTATTKTMQEAVAAVNAINPAMLNNKNNQKALTNQLNAALTLADQGSYADALTQLQDTLGKTDGCVASGAPDKNDWLTDCDSQEQVQPLLQEAIEYLNSMM